MPFIDLSILNQRQTPAFYADVLANRPAAGFVGRIFVSTDTFAFYRDNGTSWDLIGGPGTGTITGSGANGQVSYWNGASTITGSNDLFFDAVNGYFGIGTNTPGTALGINHDQNQIIQINQTTATNDTKIAFQNSGIGLWRIGNSYNGGANDFAIYDNIGAIQQFTIKKTTGQTLIGGGSGGSGKLVVESGASDNGIQIVSTTAPSLRIDNANTGPTKRVGLGISTGVNNFIQGSADRDFCVFNSSTTASPILFGIYDAGAGNTQEAARISPARNFLLGTSTDAGQKLQVSGTALITGAATFNSSVTANNLVIKNVGVPAAQFYRDLDVSIVGTAGQGIEFGARNGATFIAAASIYGGLETGATTGNLVFQTLTSGSLTTKLTITNAGNVGFGTSTPNAYPNYTTLTIDGLNGSEIDFDANGVLVADMFSSSAQFNIRTVTSIPLIFSTAASERARFTSSGNLLIGTTTDAGQKLQVNGNSLITGTLSVTGASAGNSISVSQGVSIGDGYGLNAGNFQLGAITGNRFYIYNNTLGIDNIVIDPSTGVTKFNRRINIQGLPTSPVGLVAGDVWNNLGVLNIV